MKKWFDAKAFSGSGNDRDKKGRFANVFAHFISADYPREKTPGWFLNRVGNLFGLSYRDPDLVYHHHFSTAVKKIYFIEFCWNYMPEPKNE